MGFFDDYRASLKPIEVEEPIDRYFHRPIAYVLAKLCAAIGVSADAVTMSSIAFGVAGGVCVVWPFPWHAQVAALLVFISVICDCADGQIARMTGKSSPFGRMLDGCADAVVTVAVAPATVWMVAKTNAGSNLQLGVLAALGVATMVTSSFHTAMYDHYKNVWQHFTKPGFADGEDLEEYEARWSAAPPEQRTWLHRRFRWLYRFYLKNLEDVARGFDPALPPAARRLPPYAPEHDAIWRRRAARVWSLLRQQFGFGSLMFGLTIVNLTGTGRLALVYMAYRLVFLNLLFYAVIRPMQRRASAAAMDDVEALGAWRRPV